MTCHACKAKSCFTHDVPWHTDMTCNQFDEELKKEDKANKVYYEKILVDYETTYLFILALNNIFEGVIL